METIAGRRKRGLISDVHRPKKDKTEQLVAKKPKSKRAEKRERQVALELEEEQRLTALLFGMGIPAKEARRNIDESDEKDEADSDKEEVKFDDEEIFQIDRDGDKNDDDEYDADDQQEHELEKVPFGNDLGLAQAGSSLVPEAHLKVKSKIPAWVDEDDANVEANLFETNRLRKLRTFKSEDVTHLPGTELQSRLRRRYIDTAQASARTDWAQVPLHEGSIVADGMAEASSVPLLSGQSPDSNGPRLPPHILKIVRCPDVNESDPNQAAVQAVNFHPGSDPDRPLVLTAGLDKTLRFFQVGADKSKKIHGVHFPRLPIYSASFIGNSGNVVVSGRRSFFYIYDTVAGKLDLVPRIPGREEKSWERSFASPDGSTLAFCGNDGYVVLFDARRKKWIADVKMNASVRAITFDANGDSVLASGSDGDVYRWDLRTRKCVERFNNQDGTITSCLTMTSRHLAVGAESGVVNLYYADRVALNEKRTPIESIMNLQTSADLVRFNHDGQILALSSRREKKQLKLFHVPSSTVFSNWPTSKTPLNYVWSLDFSPRSHFLAIGNDQGKCLLYRLLHYKE